MKMGYEFDKSLFAVTYDWRQSNRQSAYHLGQILKNEVQLNAPAYVTHTTEAIELERLEGQPQITVPAGTVQADVVVHSMGGMVLRSYLEDLAIDIQPPPSSNDIPLISSLPYQGNVNQAVTIATPHQGFPATYNTYEGLTWEDYFSDEVSPWSDPGLWLKSK